ncbi:NADPH:quinone oxidoreductase family protein [Nocardia abscessus]|uniref:NADPH:quinone oxidoreductase family protein n=1 Tax=Nocardia abscessus TaxID=120957 RepID=UPI002455639A|nr:NADPH:quinone oxidoreductase family protein [Nocardia abscessus]
MVGGRGVPPAPRPAAGQVRVRVAAAAVNFPDVLLIADKYQVSVAPPFVPGSEFAGIVEEIGDNVTGFAIGDRVTGTGLFGAFAEAVVVTPAALTRIPEGVDLRTAAAYRTAYHTLRSVARVGASDRVIVLGAGGGVGLAAVQLAVRMGAEVTAVASSAEKLAAANRYGARHLIDHTERPLRDALRDALPDGADAVIDPVGGDLTEPAMRSLARRGRFVTVGYASGVIPRIPLNVVLIKGVRLLGFQFQDLDPAEYRRNEGELAALLAGGQVRPHIGARYPLEQVASALRHVADGRAIGKVLVDVCGDQPLSAPGSGGTG